MQRLNILFKTTAYANLAMACLQTVINFLVIGLFLKYWKTYFEHKIVLNNIVKSNIYMGSSQKVGTEHTSQFLA